jgi:hypothetical protein
MTDRDRLVEALKDEDWPDGMEMIRQLRDAVGLFSGAMPISPKQAWEDAIARVKQLAAARRVLSARPPDYEAAARVLANNDGIEIVEWHEDLGRRVVDAALGGPDKLILDPEDSR